MKTEVSNIKTSATLKRSLQTIASYEWLKLFKAIGRKGEISFKVGFFRSGKNNNFIMTLEHDEKRALILWRKLTKTVPLLNSEDEKRQWLEAGIISPPKRYANRGTGFDLDFGSAALASKLRSICDDICKGTSTTSNKNKILGVCRGLAQQAGANENLTPRVAKSYFDKLKLIDSHLSPKTLIGYKGIVIRVARKIGLSSKQVNEIDEVLTIPTKSELKRMRINFVEKNRPHLERDQVEAFALALYNDPLPNGAPEKSNIWILLATGWRPNMGGCAKLYSSSIFANTSWESGREVPLKTASEGVEEITIARTPVIDAILFLTDCKPQSTSTTSAHNYFTSIIQKSFGIKTQGMDRYALRHTALTWMSHSFSLVKVRDIAGLRSIRMLEDNYVKRAVKDKREWHEAMPLNCEEIPKDWHGFLLECIMVAKWPDLRNGRSPTEDPQFQKLLQILRKNLETRPALRLIN